MRRDGIRLVAVLHLGVVEPDGQVPAALPARRRPGGPEPLERHVPEPRRVAAVGDAGVDGDDDRGRRPGPADRTPRASRPDSWPAGAGPGSNRRRPTGSARRPRSVAGHGRQCGPPGTPKRPAAAMAMARWPGWPARAGAGASGQPLAGRGDDGLALDPHVEGGPAQRAGGAGPSGGGPSVPKWIRPPQLGQPEASAVQGWPAPTQVTERGGRCRPRRPAGRRRWRPRGRGRSGQDSRARWRSGGAPRCCGRAGRGSG